MDDAAVTAIDRIERIEREEARVRGNIAVGQAVGYTTHHEGVHYVARAVVEATTKTRGPPAANR